MERKTYLSVNHKIHALVKCKLARLLAQINIQKYASLAKFSSAFSTAAFMWCSLLYQTEFCACRKSRVEILDVDLKSELMLLMLYLNLQEMLYLIMYPPIAKSLFNNMHFYYSLQCTSPFCLASAASVQHPTHVSNLHLDLRSIYCTYC
ncbi:hypothetical protein KIL84_001202 [Mauremys mutica]|uniref:Uncharacterized protein n=1 Tax=Mauremys mutica TaxID=74926 RepID=A0A9D4AP25_9SAUR|nr:hypothetical protein KIL84_001202 [Mauremys mutica]